MTMTMKIIMIINFNAEFLNFKSQGLEVRIPGPGKPHDLAFSVNDLAFYTSWQLLIISHGVSQILNIKLYFNDTYMTMTMKIIMIINFNAEFLNF